ncbi:hypothetical protein Ae201684P_021968 [Aphanomyces euteiches]|uniref:Uncharacterized protein n=1 Tax=Aphanomyces euteiches TaxID=100861 RepID=A0A6G0WTA5_9STRA|nr:hypothetical protein Ae201684_012095 [Aphanomyces euteiches]KAH9056231.1 hypothetical protein Ae201684P_021968 [Aphanomyces euteiches]
MSMTSFLIRRISRENDELKEQQQQLQQQQQPRRHNIQNVSECHQLIQQFQSAQQTQVPVECRDLLHQSNQLNDRQIHPIAMRRRLTRNVQDDFDRSA